MTTNPMIVQGLEELLIRVVPASFVVGFHLPVSNIFALPRILAFAVATAGSIYTAAQLGQQRAEWLVLSVLAFLLLAGALVLWANRPTNDPNAGKRLGKLIVALSLVLFGYSSWLIVQNAAPSVSALGTLESTIASVLLICIPVLLGCSLSLAIQSTALELTQGGRLGSTENTSKQSKRKSKKRAKGSPKSSSSVSLGMQGINGQLAGRWQRLIGWGAAASVLVICAHLLWMPVDRETPAWELILAKLFGLTMATLTFAGWLLERRFSHLQLPEPNSESDRSSAASLAIAAWFISLSYVVACALPMGWPWS